MKLRTYPQIILTFFNALIAAVKRKALTFPLAKIPDQWLYYGPKRIGYFPGFYVYMLVSIAEKHIAVFRKCLVIYG
jgi:hypothetical protein